MSEEFDYRSIPLRQTPSIPDPRNWSISKLIPKSQITTVFPEDFEIPYNHEIKNQGQYGMCVSFSATYCREITQEQQSGKYVEFSPSFIYANRNSGEYTGEGMYPQNMLDHLKSEGICEKSLFPQLGTFPELKPFLDQNKDKLFANAYQNTISAYAQIVTIEDIKNSLMQLGPLTIEIPIYSSFWGINSQNSVIPIPDVKNETLAGFHEVTINSWDKLGNFGIINSWGNSWGKNGCCSMSPAFLPFVIIMFSMTDNILPTPIPPNPQPNPEPQPEPTPTPITHDYKLTTTFQSSTVNDGANNNVTISTMDGLTPVIDQNVNIQVKRSGQIYTPNIAGNNGVIVIAFQSSTEEEIEVDTTWISPDNISHTASATATWKNPNPQPQPIPTPSLVSINVDPLILTLTVGTSSPISIKARYSDSTTSVITGLSTFVFSNTNASFNNGNINGLVAGNCLVTVSYKGMNTVLNVVVVDEVKPIPDNNKLYHVQTIPINSTKNSRNSKTTGRVKGIRI